MGCHAGAGGGGGIATAGGTDGIGFTGEMGVAEGLQAQRIERMNRMDRMGFIALFSGVGADVDQLRDHEKEKGEEKAAASHNGGGGADVGIAGPDYNEGD